MKLVLVVFSSVDDTSSKESIEWFHHSFSVLLFF